MIQYSFMDNVCLIRVFWGFFFNISWNYPSTLLPKVVAIFEFLINMTNSEIFEFLINMTNSEIFEFLINMTNSEIFELLINMTNSEIFEFLINMTNSEIFAPPLDESWTRHFQTRLIQVFKFLILKVLGLAKISRNVFWTLKLLHVSLKL